MAGKIDPIIPCGTPLLSKEEIASYAEELRNAAPTVGSHGLSPDAFWKSGLFRAAVERIRGAQAATMANKKTFLAEILEHMKTQKVIQNWDFTGAGERHDYIIKVNKKLECAIEQKGCLDGNNTNIFKRPPNADEFIIWSLCPNPGSNMQHNAWSGIHTRLGAELIDTREKVDALVIWDYICGTDDRPCPKLKKNPGRTTKLSHYEVPPPCIYLFPRTIPDPRNNPNPSSWELDDIKFLRRLYDTFKCNVEDVIYIQIEARMNGSDVQRKTTFIREGKVITSSKWTKISRSK